MMTDKQINDLLDRFMAGETSEQEERLLTDYFCTRTDIPEAWAAYAVMFRGFRQSADDEHKTSSIYKPGAHWGPLRSSLQSFSASPVDGGCGCHTAVAGPLVVYA